MVTWNCKSFHWPSSHYNDRKLYESGAEGKKHDAIKYISISWLQILSVGTRLCCNSFFAYLRNVSLKNLTRPYAQQQSFSYKHDFIITLSSCYYYYYIIIDKYWILFKFYMYMKYCCDIIYKNYNIFCCLKIEYFRYKNLIKIIEYRKLSSNSISLQGLNHELYHIYLTLSMHPYFHCIAQTLSTYKQLRKTECIINWLRWLWWITQLYLLLLRNRLLLWFNFTSLRLLIEILIKKLSVCVYGIYKICVYCICSYMCILVIHIFLNLFFDAYSRNQKLA